MHVLTCLWNGTQSNSKFIHLFSAFESTFLCISKKKLQGSSQELLLAVSRAAACTTRGMAEGNGQILNKSYVARQHFNHMLK